MILLEVCCMNNKVSVTPSLAIEYLYCPRFVYFMKVLNIDQNEETRFKVQKGREIHKYKELSKSEYKRKKIGVVEKIIEEELYSDKYNIHGKVDEILFLDDGTAAPLDYKFAEFNDKIYKTYKFQMVMYSMMISDNYDVKVNRGYLVYTRSRNYIEEISIRNEDFIEVKEIIDNILKIINMNYFPVGTTAKSRCIDCCYRNLCIK